MAISHSVSDHIDLVRGTTISKNTVVPAGSDIAALVGVDWVNEVLTDEYISTVTVDGINATFIHLVQSATSIVEQYYVPGLTAGTKTTTVTWAGTSPIITAVVGIEYMNGVHQTTSVGATGTGSGFSTTPSIVVATTDVLGFVVDTLYSDANTPASATPDPGQTSRWSRVSIGTPPTRINGHGSSKSSAATGTTMSWSLSGSRAWAQTGVEFRPSASSTLPAINVRTSYDYLEVSPDKLDRADRLPEEARMVWIGRWRH